MTTRHAFREAGADLIWHSPTGNTNDANSDKTTSSRAGYPAPLDF
jgi:hypothetical protein